jgi:hypothetical protein
MNETQADILAEMRRHIQAARDYPHDIEITVCDVENWADRIEAAAAREREAAEARQTNECVVVREEEAAEWRERIGNAAALREALVKTLDAFKSGAIRTEWNDPDSWKHDDELWYLKNDIESALAAPPRNCDRFKAADEARMAFWDTHETIWDAFKNRGGTELFYEVLDWLFAKAEGGMEC